MRTMMTILLAAGLLQAQDKPAEVKPEPREAVIIPVKTLTGDSFDRLVKLLGVFNAQYSADKNLRTILVYAPKDVVEQMRKVVAELDRPGSEAAIGRNIDMTMTFLKCSTKACIRRVRAFQPISRLSRSSCAPRRSTRISSCGMWCRSVYKKGRRLNRSLRLPGSPPGRVSPCGYSNAPGVRWPQRSRPLRSFRVCEDRLSDANRRCNAFSTWTSDSILRVTSWKARKPCLAKCPEWKKTQRSLW